MATRATATDVCHGRDPRTRFGWESLTEAELRVVGLAAEGLTNRQVAERLFISRRTVATHLEHVFQKLGFSTRARLAAEAVRRLG
jgi:DNA-binding CsgD family transcriptional regulator